MTPRKKVKAPSTVQRERWARPKPDAVGFPHGEYRGYQWGCRCVECTEAQRVYMADYRARKKAGQV